jgi:hypothetical protein
MQGIRRIPFKHAHYRKYFKPPTIFSDDTAAGASIAAASILG